MSHSGMPALNANQSCSLSKGIKVHGEVTGAENLHFDGELEGSIDLSGHTLIVGPSAKMKANVTAKQIVIHGRVEGNITALDLLDIRNTGIVHGELLTTRLNIEDGALIKGTVNIRREVAASSVPAQSASAQSSPSQGSAVQSSSAYGSSTHGSPSQGSEAAAEKSEKSPLSGGQINVGSQTPLSIPVEVKPNV